MPLIAPEKENFPNRIRWTVEQCQELVEAGHLRGRYELIDGEIISKMGQSPPHRIVLMLIADWLMTLFSSLRVQTQFSIRMSGEEGRYTEPQPDIAVTIEPATAYVSSNPGPSDLLAIIEVADASLRFDLGTKSLVYARAGIREYWVADIAGRQVHIHRDPGADGYRTVERAVMGDTIALESRPNDSVAVATFFPDAIAGISSPQV